MDTPGVSHMEGLRVDHKQQATGLHHLAQRITRIRTGEGDGKGNHGGKVGPEDCRTSYDVQISYVYLDTGRCMEILRGYGLGHNLQRLLQWYWDKQVVVQRP